MAESNLPRSQTDWDLLARRSKFRQTLTQGGLIVLLIIVTLPVLLPYFWMLAISFSAKTGGVASFVLWRACSILVPAVIVVGLVRVFAETPETKNRITLGVVAATVVGVALLIGPYLHLENYRFFWEPDFVADLPNRGAAGVGNQFPWVWEAFLNSFILAAAQTVHSPAPSPRWPDTTCRGSPSRGAASFCKACWCCTLFRP